jgi:hypothetical protein
MVDLVYRMAESIIGGIWLPGLLIWIIRRVIRSAGCPQAFAVHG